MLMKKLNLKKDRALWSNQEMNNLSNFQQHETLPLYTEELLTHMSKLTSCDDLGTANNKYMNIIKKPIKSLYIGKTSKEELR